MRKAVFTVAQVAQLRWVLLAAIAAYMALTHDAVATEPAPEQRPAAALPIAPSAESADAQTHANEPANSPATAATAVADLPSMGSFEVEDSSAAAEHATAPPTHSRDETDPVVPAVADVPIAAPSPTVEPNPQFATQFPQSPERRDPIANPVRHSRVRPRSLAAMLDVGLPDGVVLGAAYRPAFWARLQAGAGTNSISPGVRAGVVLVPLSEGPSFTAEGGWYFEGNANSVVAQLVGPGYSNSSTAQHIGYQFVNLHLGLDFGGNNATFFIHGGMTYLHTTLRDANDLLGGRTVTAQGTTTSYSFNQDLSLSAWFPSFKLGLLVYIV